MIQIMQVHNIINQQKVAAINNSEPDENKRSVYYLWYHVLTSTENESLFGSTAAPLSLSQIGWKFRPEQSNPQILFSLK